MGSSCDSYCSISTEKTEPAPGIPTEIALWTETHTYRNTSGDHLEQPMIPVSGATIPAQGPHFRSTELSVDAFFAMNENLTSIAKIGSLGFDDPNGVVWAIPIPLIGNREIDLVLESNSNPQINCPQ